MDCGIKYIKMCEKAEKIQASWKYEDADFYLHRFPDTNGYFVGKQLITNLCSSCNVKDSHGNTFVNEYSPKGENVWLPRQDQLQEMMKKTTDYDLYTEFRIWAVRSVYPYEEIISFSMEQLWLAFVMQEKFQKIWLETEEKWITIK